MTICISTIYSKNNHLIDDYEENSKYYLLIENNDVIHINGQSIFTNIIKNEDNSFTILLNNNLYALLKNGMIFDIDGIECFDEIRIKDNDIILGKIDNICFCKKKDKLKIINIHSFQELKKQVQERFL